MSVIRIENNYSQLITNNEEIKEILWKALRFPIKGRYYNASYRMKKWDGYNDFFKKDTGRFLTGLLPEIKMALRHMNIEYQINDAREPFSFAVETVDQNWLSCGKEPITLRDYQIDYINQVIKNKRCVIPSPTACHAKGQMILMYDGTFKKVENIVIGDYLMGHDSKPRKVLKLFQGKDQMYKITPHKGNPFIVNKEHFLTLISTASHKNRCPGEKGGKIIDVKIKDWISWSKWKKHLHKLFYVGVDFKHQETELPIDPYFLGILLGDGSMYDGVKMTTMDNEILDEVNKQANKFNLRVVKHGGKNDKWKKCPTYSISGKTRRANKTKLINPITAILRKLNLWGTHCNDKFVPHVFKTASRENRLEILAGLIDTDGCLDNKNTFDFISKSKQLSEDVVFLSRSLGLWASVHECEKSDQNGTTGTYYRVYISGNTWEVPCRILRKKSIFKTRQKDTLRSGFKIETLGVDEFYGFNLENDPHYLMDDFMVTHNSGKSNVLIGILKALPPKTPTLILANRVSLVEQNYDEITKKGITNVGRFYGKRKEVDYITCSTIHSLHHIVSILPKIKAVFVDEIHEMMSKKPKAAYRRLINASIRVAMSATAFKFGGSDKVQKYEVKGWFGPPLVSHHAEDGKLTTKELQKRKILSGATCSFFKVNKPQLPYDVYMDAVTHGIAENNYFHGLVVGLVSKLEGRTLIIVERIEHGDRLKDRMPDALWVQGKDTIETRKEIIQRLKTEQGNVVAIATAGIFGVGIDTWIHNLVNAAGGQAEHVVIQRMGRGLRVASDKQHLNYYDFIFDINDYLKKHSMKRIKILKKEGHNVQIKEEIDF